MSTSGADTVVYKNSLAGPVTPDFTFRNRRFVEIRDQQGGQYDAGQVFFDATGLVSNNLFVDWTQTVLQIPYTVQFDVTSAPAGVGFDPAAMEMGHSWSLKNSVYQLINGITVNVGNQTVVPLQSWSHIPIVHKLLTSWNANDVAVLGDTIMFAKDTAESIAWLQPGTATNPFYEDNSFLGRNVQNVQATNAAATALATNQVENYYNLPYIVGNAGRLRRVQMNPNNGTAYLTVPSTVNDAERAQGYIGLRGFSTQARSQTSSINYISVLTSTQVIYNMTATIPMTWLHDLFAKMPLIRGALWQLYVHLNIPCVWSGSLGPVSGNPHNYVPYDKEPTCTTAVSGFCPFMVSPACNFGGQNTATPCRYATGLCVDNGTTALTAGQFNFTVAMKVTPKSGSCLLQVCMADLDIHQSEAYMQNPVKQVVYQDFIRVQNSSMMNLDSTTNPVRATITSGMGNLRKLLLFPYIPSAMVNGVSSCGGTALPYFHATQLQVYISGRPLFEKPVDYTFDQFWREMVGCGAMDGAANDGFRVGLIGERDFASGYGALVINLERHAADSDSVPVSVDIELTANWGNGYTGAAASPKFNMVAYLFFDRTFKVNCITGQLM